MGFKTLTLQRLANKLKKTNSVRNCKRGTLFSIFDWLVFENILNLHL